MGNKTYESVCCKCGNNTLITSEPVKVCICDNCKRIDCGVELLWKDKIGIILKVLNGGDTIDYNMIILNELSEYELIGKIIGSVVKEKNKKYGNAMVKVGKIMAIIYPEGIKLRDMPIALLLTRLLDKVCRIATNNDSDGESPWLDILGYCILVVKNTPGYKKQLDKILESIKN